MALKPINLQLGWPTPRLFPAESLSKATTTTLLDPEVAAQALIYGPDLGYTPLRSSIASWLTDFYSPHTGSITLDRIAITGGASQNLASILHVFSDPIKTKRVWMVEPTYFLACTIFQDAGLAKQLRGVPESSHGLDIDFLRRELEAFEEQQRVEVNGHDPPGLKSPEQYKKIYRHILYTTPTFSNPSAKTMSVELREKLLALAREFDILIISDDVYDFLRWPIDGPIDQKLAPIPPRFVDLDRSIVESSNDTTDGWGNAISNGSFSKIVAPGCRVGWAESTPKTILRLSQNGSTRSGGAPSHLSSTFLHHLLSSGALNTHITQILIPLYRTRYFALLSAIRKHLYPLGIRITTGEDPNSSSTTSSLPTGAGGFFTYITFPPNLPLASVIAKKAKEEQNLTFAFGEMFVVKGDEGSKARADAEGGFGHGARLCWAWEEEEQIEEGVRRLGEVVRGILGEEEK